MIPKELIINDITQGEGGGFTLVTLCMKAKVKQQFSVTEEGEGFKKSSNLCDLINGPPPNDKKIKIRFKKYSEMPKSERPKSGKRQKLNECWFGYQTFGFRSFGLF